MQMLKELEVSILISVCVCVHSLLAQTFPYVSFHRQNLANHSYVNISLVGQHYSGSDSVQCHTDLSTCCSDQQGPHRGDWYFPNGTRLPFPNNKLDIYENRSAQVVHIHRKSKIIPGIYNCSIPTIENNMGDNVYVGLYHDGGNN